jgi:imidazole glycerol-phosphate synthase subunit HisH
MIVALVDYGAGNLHSAAKAMEYAAGLASVAADVRIVSESEEILAADRILLPGDGAFRDCIGALQGRPGVVAALRQQVIANRVPFLGICVGMQLLAMEGEEHGATAGLGWLPGRIELIRPADRALKVPHMGWNTIDQHRRHPLLDGIATGEAGLHAYFLHSFHYLAADPGDLIATADYGGPVTAIVARDNIAGCQFHPEKSQRLGLALLANFLRWTP